MRLPRKRVEQEQAASRDAIEAYVPGIAGRIDNLDVPAVDILRRLPGVAGVNVLVAASKPTHRIIHFRDWHFLPRDVFILDVRQAADRPISDEEANALHEFALGRCSSVRAVKKPLPSASNQPG